MTNKAVTALRADAVLMEAVANLIRERDRLRHAVLTCWEQFPLDGHHGCAFCDSAALDHLPVPHRPGCIVRDYMESG